MIIIVSHPQDPHATEVMEYLPADQVVLLDTARYPSDMMLSLAPTTSGPGSMELVVDDRRIDLEQTTAVWWRRPQPFGLPADMTDPATRDFAWSECHAVVKALWANLDAYWINDPTCDELACRKGHQLRVATQLGIRTPRTLMTSDPDRAQSFIDGEGQAGTVYKTFTATESTWRESRLLRADELHLLDAVRHAPVIFQEYVTGDVDLRITIVGDSMFAAEITEGDRPRTGIDYRMGVGQATVREHQLPVDIQTQLRTLMTSLGLVYGAIDMRITPDGEYVFLEVNPSGEWQFIANRTGAPVAQTFAAELSAA